MSIKFKNVSKSTVILFGSSVAPGQSIAVEGRLTAHPAITRLISQGILQAPKSGPTTAVATPPVKAAAKPKEEKVEEPKAEEPKAEEPKAEEAKSEEAPAEEAPAIKEEPKKKGKKNKRKNRG